jgi:hypothetical protein
MVRRGCVRLHVERPRAPEPAPQSTLSGATPIVEPVPSEAHRA